KVSYRVGQPSRPYLIWRRAGLVKCKRLATTRNQAQANPSPARTNRTPLRSVDERSIVQIGRRELVLFRPVILVVLPLRFIAAFRQQMHASQNIARIKVL